MKITVKIPGTPKGKPAPRLLMRVKDGKPRPLVYKPRTAADWEAAIIAKLEPYIPEQPLEGPIFITAVFEFLRPQSHYTSKGKLREKYRSEWHTQRPDLDNLLKVLDVLQQMGFWRDDAKIAGIKAEKRWTEKMPGLTLIIDCPGQPEGAMRAGKPQP